MRGEAAPARPVETLVRILLGTALAEEDIFRGALFGLFTQRHSPAAPSWPRSRPRPVAVDGLAWLRVRSGSIAEPAVAPPP
jgi:hypothetical protein